MYWEASSRCNGKRLGARRSWGGVVVNVALLRVLSFLLVLRVVVAVGQPHVVVLVRVPVLAVLPLVQRIVGVAMRDVVVIVGMRHSAVRVLGLLSLTLGELRSRLR